MIKKVEAIIVIMVVLFVIAAIHISIDVDSFSGKIEKEYIQDPETRLYKVFREKKWVWTIWYGDIPGYSFYLGPQPKVGSKMEGLELTFAWRFSKIIIRKVEIAWFI